MPPKKQEPVAEPEPEEEEEEEEEGDDEFDGGGDGDEDEDDDDNYVDMGSLLTGLLSTEDGDNVCTALIKINTQIETQNKILMKMLSVLSAKQK